MESSSDLSIVPLFGGSRQTAAVSGRAVRYEALLDIDVFENQTAVSEIPA